MLTLRLAILVTLMVVELVLVWLLRSAGIVWLTETARWWATLLAALLPFLLAVAVLFRNGLRVRLRSVMYATVLFAIFLSVIVAPVSKERTLRRGVAALNAAGILVHDTLETDAGEGDSSGTAERSQILRWMAPVLGDIDRLPTDKRIRHATLENVEHVEVLLEHLHRFPNLDALSIYRNRIKRDTLTKLRSRMDDRQMKELWIFGVDGGYVDWLKSHPTIRSIYLICDPPAKPRTMQDNEVLELAKLTDLEKLVISYHKMTEEQLQELGQLRNLKFIQLHFVDIPQSAVEALQRARPDCEVVIAPRP